MSNLNRTSTIRYSLDTNKENERDDHLALLLKKNKYAKSISFKPKQFILRFNGLNEKNANIKSNLNELKAIDSCKIKTTADHHHHHYNFKKPLFSSNLNLVVKSLIKEEKSKTTQNAPDPTTPYSILYYNSSKKTTTNAPTPPPSVPINKVLSKKVSMVDYNDLDANNSNKGSTNPIDGKI